MSLNHGKVHYGYLRQDLEVFSSKMGNVNLFDSGRNEYKPILTPLQEQFLISRFFLEFEILLSLKVL